MNNSNSYNAFKEANAPKHVSGIDYIHTIYKALDLPSDFVLWFSRLFFPSFLIVNDGVFVTELFDKKRYDDFLRQGYSKSSAQFWTNLLEITGLFDEMLESQALEVAESLAASWNKKIEEECSEYAGRARAIFDEDTREIFVTIGQPD